LIVGALCELDVSLPMKVMKRCGVNIYDESSETVLASACGLLAELASKAAYRASAAAGLFSRRSQRKLRLSIVTRVSAGSAN